MKRPWRTDFPWTKIQNASRVLAWQYNVDTVQLWASEVGFDRRQSKEIKIVNQQAELLSQSLAGRIELFSDQKELLAVNLWELEGGSLIFPVCTMSIVAVPSLLHDCVSWRP